MADVNSVILIITLNVNGLNSPFKRQMSDCIKIIQVYTVLLEGHFRFKDINKLKIKRNNLNNHKNAVVAILISVKIDLKNYLR